MVRPDTKIKVRLSPRLRRRLADEIERERWKALGRPQPGRRKPGRDFPTVSSTLHRTTGLKRRARQADAGARRWYRHRLT